MEWEMEYAVRQCNLPERPADPGLVFDIQLMVGDSFNRGIADRQNTSTPKFSAPPEHKNSGERFYQIYRTEGALQNI